MENDRRSRALDLIQREALLLDEQRWAEWLALYHPDGVFWVPMWKDETRPTSDPDTELSFIRMDGIAQLEERVRRVTSGRAVSAMPIPRTSHLVGPGLVDSGQGDPGQGDSGQVEGEAIAETVIVRSAFRSQAYLHKGNRTIEYAGRYTHELVNEAGAWRIGRKTILLNCDFLQSQLDFFFI